MPQAALAANIDDDPSQSHDLDMERETTQATGNQSGDHVVDIQVQPEDAQCPSVDDGSLHPTSNDKDTAECQHVVNLEHIEGDTTNCCVVCTDPLEWVAIGRCGHRVVCPKCMARIRFIYSNKRCCICRTYCFRVLVTKPDSDGAMTSILPLFAFWEGRIGKYWYHRHTSAYFEDEKQYEEAKNACKGIIKPCYNPKVVFLLYLIAFIATGFSMGVAFTNESNNNFIKVRAYAVGISVALLLGVLSWTLICKWAADPLEALESYRQSHSLSL